MILAVGNLLLAVLLQKDVLCQISIYPDYGKNFALEGLLHQGTSHKLPATSR